MDPSMFVTMNKPRRQRNIVLVGGPAQAKLISPSPSRGPASARAPAPAFHNVVHLVSHLEAELRAGRQAGLKG